MDTAFAPPVTRLERPSLPEVYDAHFNLVWRTLKRLGVWERELEDATHDVFIVVHRKLNDYDPARPIKPWLVGIAARVASEFRRRAQHRREVVSADDAVQSAAQHAAAPSHNATHGIEAQQQKALVYQALATLDDDKRTALVLVDMEGHSVADVAVMLEVNVNTLYARVRVARQAFAEALQQLTLASEGRRA